MKNIQILPLNNMDINTFKNNTLDVAKHLKWKKKYKSEENSLFFTTLPNMDSSLGNNIEVRYLNHYVGMICVSARNKLQIAESGDTINKILDFIEIFYKENSP